MMPDINTRPEPRWRTGRKVGNTIYRQTGPGPCDDDLVIGFCVTPSYAARLVEDANGAEPYVTSGRDEQESRELALFQRAEVAERLARQLLADRSTEAPQPRVLPETATVDRYRLSMLTEADCSDWWVWNIYVERRDATRWAVTRGGGISLDADGGWSIEQRPDYPGDPVIDRWRFDLDTALRLAEAELPLMRINGSTAPDIIARRRVIEDTETAE